MSSLQALTVVLLRLMGACSVVVSLFGASVYVAPLIHGIISPNGSSPDVSGLTSGAVLSLAAALIGVGIWIFARALVRLFVRSLEEGAIQGEMSPFDLIGAGTFLIGLYFVFGSLPDAVVRTGFLVVTLVSPHTTDGVVATMVGAQTLAVEWGQVLLSLILITRPYLMVRSFDRLRSSALAARARAG